MATKSKHKKRTLSAEQLQKMKEGRERAAAKRAEEAKQKERVEMLSDLDERLRQGRRNAESNKPVKVRSRRRRYNRT
jgi:hypothetical protein